MMEIIINRMYLTRWERVESIVNCMKVEQISDLYFHVHAGKNSNFFLNFRF